MSDRPEANGADEDEPTPYLVDPREQQEHTADDEDDDIDHDPRPAQEDIIRSDAYPIRVLAGAGTGKTFTMVRKIGRLLEHTPPSDVLALTFTNKAADSMREKLADQLDSRAYDIDAYTYHSIANEILSEHAYEAGIDPEFEIASEPEQYAIIYELLDDIDYRFIAPSAYAVDGPGTGIEKQLQSFITDCKQKGISPEALRGQMGYLPPAATLLELDDLLERLEEVASEAIGSLNRKRSIKPAYFETLVTGLETIEAELESISSEVGTLAREQGGADSQVSNASADFDHYLDAMTRFTRSYREMLEANEDRLVGSSMAGVLKYPLYVFGATGGTGSFPDNLDPVCLVDELRDFLDSCMAAHDLAAGYRRYEEQLDEYGYLDLQDLILEATALVSDPEIAARIDTRWEYVFCDEFQDTDPIQFRLVANLVGDGKLFVVGDDDQAVYEWRGANVDNIREDLEKTYGAAEQAPIADLRTETRAESGELDDPEIERTTERLGGGHPGLTDLPLEENFRSVQPILDLANEAVDLIPDRGSDKTLRAVGAAAEADEGVYTVEAPEDDEDGERVQLVNTIRRLATGETDVVSEAQSLGDIGVLVRTNDDAQALATKLDEVGIPYEVAGGMAAHSTGVDTVTAFLKLLADPDDEVSLNRVLRLRYRLHETDLARLNTGEKPSLWMLLRAEQSDGFTDWERVEQAKSHVTTLLRRRDAYSLSRLYSGVKDVTDIEWFMTEREREDLGYLDDVIAEFGSGPLQPELTPGFIEYLRVHAETVRDSGGVNAQPELADEAVNILTVHKSKGLEFPTVLLPHLHTWGPNRRDSAALDRWIDSFASDDGLPMSHQSERQDRTEERRTLHVAITRAEENLVLFGRSDDEESDESDEPDQQWEYLEAGTPDADPDGVELTPTAGSFDAWRTITTCLPSTARDVTDTLASDLTPAGEPEIDELIDGAPTTDSSDEPADESSIDLMDPEAIQLDWRAPFREAAARIVDLGEGMVAGRLDRVDLDGHGIAPHATTDRRPPSVLRRHSYTSLSMYDTCPRQHYLKYVVDAPTVEAVYDPSDRMSGTSARDGASGRGVSPRDLGIVFHETAEEIAQRCVDPRIGGTDADDWPLSLDDWRSVARRRSQGKGTDQAALVDEVTSCVENLFSLEVTEWRPRAAEHAFEYPLFVDLGDERRAYTLTGVIDAVFEKPDGSLVVLDYKTGTRELGQGNLQLPLYALAADRLFTARIDSMAYAFLNDRMPPHIDEKQPRLDAADYEDRLSLFVLNASENGYDDPDPGGHCDGCAYARLPCYDPSGG